MNLLIRAVYNVVIFAGTAYLVGWHGWNPWWFAFSLLLGASFSENKCKK
jgi:hypothetical protein